MARCTKVGAPSLETELRLRLPLVKWPPALIDEWQRSFNISLVDSEDGVIVDGLAAACDSAVDDLGNGTKMDVRGQLQEAQNTLAAEESDKENSNSKRASPPPLLPQLALPKNTDGRALLRMTQKRLLNYCEGNAAVAKAAYDAVRRESKRMEEQYAQHRQRITGMSRKVTRKDDY